MRGGLFGEPSNVSENLTEEETKKEEESPKHFSVSFFAKRINGKD